MDDEKLITLVEINDILYNKFNKNYRIPEKKQAVWSKISKEMGIPEEFCMKRWSSLRDRYTKEKKNEKLASGSGVPFIHRWQYINQLEFLAPHVISRPLRGLRGQRIRMTSLVNKHSPQTSPQPLPTASPSTSPTALPSNCEEFTQIFDDPLIDPSFLHKKCKNANPDVDRSFCEAVETLKKACALNEARNANPAIHAFGEMIVSTICSMNSRNQIKAMHQVTDMVMRIKLEEDELLDQVTYSTH